MQVALKIYELDAGSYPAALDALTSSSERHPGGFLNSGEVPADGWGRQLRYELSAGEFRLWSVGPDGIDQRGRGDDILAR